LSGFEVSSVSRPLQLQEETASKAVQAAGNSIIKSPYSLVPESCFVVIMTE
jgi:hypothetical protein